MINSNVPLFSLEDNPEETWTTLRRHSAMRNWIDALLNPDLSRFLPSGDPSPSDLWESKLLKKFCFLIFLLQYFISNALLGRIEI